MNLSRSSYYYPPQNPKELENEFLEKRIEELAEEFNGYGYRRITAQLHREGIKVNHKKVSKIMRKKGLICKLKRRFVKTTDSNHPYPIYSNLIEDLKVTGLNQVWVCRTSPTSGFQPDLSIWLLFWTCFPVKSSAMPFPKT